MQDGVNDIVASHPKHSVWLGAMHSSGQVFWMQDLERTSTQLLITGAEPIELQEARRSTGS